MSDVTVNEVTVSDRTVNEVTVSEVTVSALHSVFSRGESRRNFLGNFARLCKRTHG